jgi:hypothetical protein
VSSISDVAERTLQESTTGFSGPRLNGVWQKVAITAWAALFLFSLLSFVLSLICLNIWDRVPAVSLPQYFPDLNQAAIGARSTFQNEVLMMGFTLTSFALLLTAFRLVGGLSVFILSAVIVQAAGTNGWRSCWRPCWR